LKALIIVHWPGEGPGTLEPFLRNAGIELTIAELFKGDQIPARPEGFDLIVSMGGPMNVYAEDQYPFLRTETELLRSAIPANIPVLGICLGAQMIAKALNAEVKLAAAKEVGWHTVELTDAGKRDVLFQGLPGSLDVLQWHEDMFTIPEGGVLLASSDACPHQAFRCRNAYGLQFHVEVDKDIVTGWFEHEPQRDEILPHMDRMQPILLAEAERVYENFLSLVQG
jgi:GMP synthase (glutamine-hydrolysing)